jgi:rubrerythrin
MRPATIHITIPLHVLRDLTPEARREVLDYELMESERKMRRAMQIASYNEARLEHLRKVAENRICGYGHDNPEGRIPCPECKRTDYLAH